MHCKLLILLILLLIASTFKTSTNNAIRLRLLAPSCTTFCIENGNKCLKLNIHHICMKFQQPTVIVTTKVKTKGGTRLCGLNLDKGLLPCLSTQAKMKIKIS